MYTSIEVLECKTWSDFNWITLYSEKNDGFYGTVEILSRQQISLLQRSLKHGAVFMKSATVKKASNCKFFWDLYKISPVNYVETFFRP